MKHFLIEKSICKPDNINPKMPEGSYYDIESGLWKDSNANCLIKNHDFKLNKTTKKCDIETGEDQKGE